MQKDLEKKNELKNSLYRKTLENLEEQVYSQKKAKIEKMFDDKLSQVEKAKMDFEKERNQRDYLDLGDIGNTTIIKKNNGMGCNFLMFLFQLIPKPGCCSSLFLLFVALALVVFGILSNASIRDATVGNFLYKYINDGYTVSTEFETTPNFDLQNRLNLIADSNQKLATTQIYEGEMNYLLNNLDIKLFGSPTLKFVKIEDNLLHLYLKRENVSDDIWLVIDVAIDSQKKPIITKIKYGKINLDMTSLRQFQGNIPIVNSINIENLDKEFFKLAFPQDFPYNIENIILQNGKIELSLIQK